MAKETGTNTGALKKWESIAKIIGGLSIPFIGAIVSIILHVSAEDNRRTQLFAEILSKRESADSSIRASMFNTLMQQYLGELTVDRSMDTTVNLHNQVVFLELLINNFQEYFNSRPLFEDLYDRINNLKKKLEENSAGNSEDIGKLDNLRREIIDISKSTAKKQEVMLSRIGITKDVHMKINTHKCVLLYNPGDELKINKQSEESAIMPLEMDRECASLSKDSEDSKDQELGKEEIDKLKADDKKYFAIQIKAFAIHDHEVQIEMSAFQDLFKNNVHVHRKNIKDIKFGVSYFDLPYMDNTRLFDGSRFALVLRDIPDKEWVELGIISFREEFMSLRDRPFIEDMLNKLHESAPEA